MHKFTTPLALVLTLGLLILGARLPRLVTGAMDRSQLNQPLTAPMAGVELELHDGATLDVLELMALHSRMQNLPIGTDEATMTQDQVYAAVEAQMAAFVEAGLFKWFPTDYVWAEPHLAIDSKDHGRYSVFWSVDYSTSGKRADYRDLFVHLDDATGRLLHISFTGWEGQLSNEEALQRAAKLQDIYLSQLGLEQSTLNEYLTVIDEHEVSNGILETSYQLYVPDLGDVTLNFQIGPGMMAVFLN